MVYMNVLDSLYELRLEFTRCKINYKLFNFFANSFAGLIFDEAIYN